MFFVYLVEIIGAVGVCHSKMYVPAVAFDFSGLIGRALHLCFSEHFSFPSGVVAAAVVAENIIFPLICLFLFFKKPEHVFRIRHQDPVVEIDSCLLGRPHSEDP